MASIESASSDRRWLVEVVCAAATLVALVLGFVSLGLAPLLIGAGS